MPADVPASVPVSVPVRVPVRMKLLSLGLWAALGCGAAAPVAPTTLAGATVHYAPMAMRDDARRPNQAVVLGTDEANGSTVLTLPAVARTIELGAITLMASPAAPAAPAAMSSMSSLAAPAPVPPWTAGQWSAAMAVAVALGKDLPDLTLSMTGDPAASPALIAAGWLASATGEAVDPAATVIGALAPDGAVLPVPGLADQLRAAVAHGKTRVGIPAGARDLIALAHAHRAEAIELATVHDAYQLLTHKKLPAPVPVGEADMALDGDTTRALDALYLGWQRRLAVEWAALLQLEQAGRQPPAIAALDQRAHARGEQAEALRRAGKLPAAYARLVDAWVCAAAANRTRGVVRALTAGKLDDALAQLAVAPDEPSLATVLDKLGALRPSSVTGHLAMVDGFQTALRGWGDQRAAIEAVAAATQLLTGLRVELSAPTTADAAAAAVAPAIELVLRAASEAAVADEQLALAPDQGAAARPPTLARLAPSYAAAATAQLGYVDALITATTKTTTRDLARRQLATIEPELPIAIALSAMSDGLPRERIAAWGDAPASELLVLAGHTEALHAAGVVIARHLGLAPAALLTVAARTARAAARAAQVATGAIPLRARLAYQRARSLDDPFAALAALWASTDASRTAVVLARN